MPTLGTLASGLRSAAHRRKSEIFITELDDDGSVMLRGVPQYRRFQYFPDSIQDSKQVNYQTKEVPGGSLPLYQYVNSGERQISFTVYVTTDVDHLVGAGSSQSDPTAIARNAAAARGSSGLPGDQRVDGATFRDGTLEAAVQSTNTRLQAAGALGRNPYIPAALAWLRRFVLPRYGEDSGVGVPLTKAPRKLYLHIVNSGIERLGGMGGFSAPGGGICCIMTECEITFEAFFPTGNPRIAQVSLGFAEVPQLGGAVRFPQSEGMDDFVSSLYTLTASSRAGLDGG